VKRFFLFFTRGFWALDFGLWRRYHSSIFIIVVGIIIASSLSLLRRCSLLTLLIVAIVFGRRYVTLCHKRQTVMIYDAWWWQWRWFCWLWRRYFSVAESIFILASDSLPTGSKLFSSLPMDLGRWLYGSGGGITALFYSLFFSAATLYLLFHCC